MARKTTEKAITLEDIAEYVNKVIDEKLSNQPAKPVATSTDNITGLIEQKLNDAISKLSDRVIESTSERISLKGGTYKIEADSDGLVFLKGRDVPLILSKNGQLGSGIRSPRSFGKGSAHFKAGNGSAGIMPSGGSYATRGLIVEGDGDDDTSYSFRALSRRNKMGFNVFSDGSVALNTMDRIDGSTLSVYHRNGAEPALTIEAASKDVVSSLLHVKSNAAPSSIWDAITVSSDTNNELLNTKMFAVNGKGDIQGNACYTNLRGYAEMFEWADNNAREEDRTGFTVTVTKTGQIRVADEGDVVIGVVVPNAAFVGNSSWNHWDKKFHKNPTGGVKTEQYTLVEWLDDDRTEVKSFYTDELTADYALPENAIEIQSDEYGNELNRPVVNPNYEEGNDYEPRTKRKEWATVCLFGSVAMYKGQLMNKNWVKIKDIDDELELVLIK